MHSIITNQRAHFLFSVLNARTREKIDLFLLLAQVVRKLYTLLVLVERPPEINVQ